MDVRRGVVVGFAAALTLVVTACGSAGQPAPGAGSTTTTITTAAKSNAAKPAEPTDPATSSDPERLNEAESFTAGQSSEPPVCELVTTAQARAILGASVRAPIVASQGPSCVYRAHVKKGENPRDGFVAIAIQHRGIAEARKQLTRPRRVVVSGHAGVCGTSGQPMMFVEAPADRVLAIVGSCGTAKRFAALALARLTS